MALTFGPELVFKAFYVALLKMPPERHRSVRAQRDRELSQPLYDSTAMRSPDRVGRADYKVS